jgi:hypothetical protein
MKTFEFNNDKILIQKDQYQNDRVALQFFDAGFAIVHVVEPLNTDEID